MKKSFKDILFVLIQGLLLIGYLFNPEALHINFSDFLHGFGGSFLLVGVIIFIMAIVNLKRNLSPFPTPKPKAELVQTGIYKSIRHPIYTGILVAGLGLSLLTDSGGRLIVTVLLFVLFYYKSKYEEQQLSEKFTGYADYKRTAGRFLPKYFSWL